MAGTSSGFDRFQRNQPWEWRRTEIWFGPQHSRNSEAAWDHPGGRSTKGTIQNFDPYNRSIAQFNCIITHTIA